jgi:proline dehydrogenase
MYRGAKALFYALSKSAVLKRFASRHGIAGNWGFARRFIAGETVAEAVEVARRLNSAGRHVTLDYLGESVRTIDEATAAAHEYVRLIKVILAAGVEGNLSIKLTQLGLAIDRATCVDNLRRILDPAQRHGFYVRIDMENSPYTAVTLDVFETLWRQDYHNLGVALQAYLYRTEADVHRMNELGAKVRLVKGAYKEPASAAYQKVSEVNAAFLRLAKLLLDAGTYPAIATHDENLLNQTRAYAAGQGIAKDRYEFQLLYGVRRDMQATLVTLGHRVRVYIPFGREWFPYFMRRLGERPSNVAFVLRSLWKEGST